MNKFIIFAFCLLAVVATAKHHRRAAAHKKHGDKDRLWEFGHSFDVGGYDVGGHIGHSAGGWNAGVSAGADGVYGKLGGGESNGHAYATFGGGVKGSFGGVGGHADVNDRVSAGGFDAPTWSAGVSAGGFGASVGGTFEELDAEEGEEGGEEGAESGEDIAFWKFGHSFDVGGYDIGGHIGHSANGWNAGVSAGADGVYGKLGGGESNGHAYGTFGAGVKGGFGGVNGHAGVNDRVSAGGFDAPTWSAGVSAGGMGASIGGTFE